MNRYIAESVVRLVVDSELGVEKFSRIARYAGTTEADALAAIQREILALRKQVAELRMTKDFTTGQRSSSHA